jgi:hypothetical protein
MPWPRDDGLLVVPNEIHLAAAAAEQSPLNNETGSCPSSLARTRKIACTAAKAMEIWTGVVPVPLQFIASVPTPKKWTACWSLAVVEPIGLTVNATSTCTRMDEHCLAISVHLRPL